MSEEKTYAQMRREFQELFYKKLLPELEKYEKERKIRLYLASFAVIVCTIAALIIAIGSFFVMDKWDSDTLGLPCAIFVGGLGIWVYIKKTFESKIKLQIMPLVCKCYSNLRWRENSYTDAYFFVRSNLIPDYTSDRFDDIFYGSYRDVNFEIVESQFIKGSGRNERIIFNGVIVKLDMNKNFTGNTIIKPDTLTHFSPSYSLKYTTLEDVVFEKKFDVFTDNEVEARYLITPSFMERLNKMKVTFNAHGVSCAFFEKCLLIALATEEDLFSLCSLTKPVNDSKQFFTMFEQILSIIKLIDHFKLNQKIGM